MKSVDRAMRPSPGEHPQQEHVDALRDRIAAYAAFLRREIPSWVNNPYVKVEALTHLEIDWGNEVIELQETVRAAQEQTSSSLVTGLFGSLDVQVTDPTEE